MLVIKDVYPVIYCTKEDPEFESIYAIYKTYEDADKTVETLLKREDVEAAWITIETLK